MTTPAGGQFEQATLPFGTALAVESTGATSRRFTSYERSALTGLDYAVNRQYDSLQGRFTQPDPIGMGAASLDDPQSLNMYAYCGNDPVNHVDPDGLFFKKLFGFIKKAFKWIAVALSVAVAVLTIVYAPVLFATTLKAVLGMISAVANAASSVLNAVGLTKIGAIFGIIAAGASFGTSLIAAKEMPHWKNILRAISSGATATGRTLSAFGHRKIAQILGLVSSVTGFIAGGLNADPVRDGQGNITGYKYGFNPTEWNIYKFARSTAEQVATLAGARRAAGILNAIGVIDDAGDLYMGIRDFNDGKKHASEDITRPEAKRLDILKDKLRTLYGDENEQARRQIRRKDRVDRLRSLTGTVNSLIGRVERGVALAR